MSPRITRWLLAIGERNGVNRDFRTPSAFSAGSLHVLRNGTSVARQFSETGRQTFRLTFAPDLNDIIEVAYDEQGNASSVVFPPTPEEIRTYVVLDPALDAVPGQPNAYYIERGATLLGYNVAEDDAYTPKILLRENGQELLLRAEALWTERLGDFDIVASQSTGPEGPATLGSRNAIKFSTPINPDSIYWYHYVRRGAATA